MMAQESFLLHLQIFSEKNLKGNFIANDKGGLILLLFQGWLLNACKRGSLKWIINCSDKRFFSSGYLLLAKN